MAAANHKPDSVCVYSVRASLPALVPTGRAQSGYSVLMKRKECRVEGEGGLDAFVGFHRHSMIVWFPMATKFGQPSVHDYTSVAFPPNIGTVVNMGKILLLLSVPTTCACT